MTKNTLFLIPLLTNCLLLTARADEQSHTLRLREGRDSNLAHLDIDKHDDPDSWPLESDASCFAIDAYRVRREARNSDVTLPSGHQTCVPARRFRVQNATTPQIAPEPER